MSISIGISISAISLVYGTYFYGSTGSYEVENRTRTGTNITSTGTSTMIGTGENPELSKGIDYLEWKYHMKLNRSWFQTPQQLIDADKALDEYTKALEDLKDPSPLFELEPFK